MREIKDRTSQACSTALERDTAFALRNRSEKGEPIDVRFEHGKLVLVYADNQ
jgi:alkylated DNA repair dioxygenase AlkB